MDLHSNQPNPYGLKDLVVKLERCDKIWKTLQLIRSLQDKHLEDIQDWIKREPIPSEKNFRKEPPMTFIPDKSLPLNLIGEPNIPRPYIKYQPIFNNGNESLPQFQLSEKSRVNLYHCEICSKEYCDYKRFVDHQDVVHRIVMPKKLVAKKEKIQNNRCNGELKSRQNSTDSNSQYNFNRKSVSDENIDLQTVVRNTSPQSDSIRCKLCGKYYKNIKKHMVDYHKIKYIEVLSKVTDQNSNFDNDQSSVVEFDSVNYTLAETAEKNVDQTREVTTKDIDLGVQNNANVSKRKLGMPSIGLRKRLRSVSSREEESDTGSQNGRQLKCDICGKDYANYKTLCKHKDRHKNRNEERQSLEVRKNADESVDPVSRHKTSSEIGAKSTRDKDKANNNVDNKIPRTRLSLTKERKTSDVLENGNVESLGKKENSLQIRCACGRTFRTTSILSNHKTGCKFLNETETSKSSDTRSGSDRDSGISITIKKKNNSYEIVSKDGSDEEISRNFDNIEEPEICEETSDSSSDNSDSSEFDDQSEGLVSEASKYSENHRILKLKLAEDDIDVDIEEDLCEENPSRGAADMNETIVSSATRQQVPSLRVLCKKYLIQKGVLPKEETSHKCQTCQMFLGSKEKLSKHIERHKKLMKRSCSCGIKFNGMKAFDDHVAAVHPKCVVCPYCNEKYASIVGLGEHTCFVTQGAPYTETFNETHPCPNCNIAFNDITWLDSHIRSKHLDPNLPFQCYQCLDKFPNEMARDSHLHDEHNHVSSCSVCNQKFQSIKTRQKHEAYHRGVGFPCHNCKKTYRSKRNQENHVKSVHSDFSNDKLSCFICQKSIKNKSFKKHVSRHNRILECEICKKVVYNFRNLERHIMDYHGNENYPRKKCNTCSMSFPTKEQLKAHIMVEKSVRNKHYKDA